MYSIEVDDSRKQKGVTGGVDGWLQKIAEVWADGWLKKALGVRSGVWF